mmetsp:Transcript_42574/g.109941  ORF Transcript_42574/g.109941 Transcript_42574/m.109941 type:complete len:206 (+) Transcript_42574:1144-1761(+)
MPQSPGSPATGGASAGAGALPPFSAPGFRLVEPSRRRPFLPRKGLLIEPEPLALRRGHGLSWGHPPAAASAPAQNLNALLLRCPSCTQKEPTSTLLVSPPVVVPRQRWSLAQLPIASQASCPQQWGTRPLRSQSHGNRYSHEHPSVSASLLCTTKSYMAGAYVARGNPFRNPGKPVSSSPQPLELLQALAHWHTLMLASTHSPVV